MGYFGALKGRARGARGRNKLVPVAHDQLTISADIDDKLQTILLVGRFGDEYADVIRPDETSLQGKDMDIRPRGYFEPHITCFNRQ